MEEIQTHLTQIRTTLNEHDQCFAKIDERLERVDRRFDSLRDDLGGQIRGLGVLFEGLQSSVFVLSEQMAEFIRGNKIAQRRLDLLEARQDKTEIRLKSL